MHVIVHINNWMGKSRDSIINFLINASQQQKIKLGGGVMGKRPHLNISRHFHAYCSYAILVQLLLLSAQSTSFQLINVISA